MDKMVDQVKRGVDWGVQQVKRTAEIVEAEARILALHRKVGLRSYQLWRAEQLSHPDLVEDLEEIARLEARVDSASAPPPGDHLEQTQVKPGGEVSCHKCNLPISAVARFCPHCGAPRVNG